MFSLIVFVSTSVGQVSKNPTNDSFQRIQVGDFVEIDVIGSIEDDWRGRIDDSGTISDYGLLKEPIDVLCLTTSELETRLLEELRTVLRNPRVEVRVLDRSERPLVALTGAVRNPQRYRLLRPASLQELIVFAGGLNDDSDGSVEIIRRSSLGCANVPLSRESDLEIIRFALGDIIGAPDGRTIPITSGDIVTVRKAGFVTVLGGVRSPQQIRVRSAMTVSRAIASAGGPTTRADLSKIRVYRQSDGLTEMFTVDLRTSRKSSEGILELKVGDVVEVPIRGRRAPSLVGLPPAQETREATGGLPIRTVD